MLNFGIVMSPKSLWIKISQVLLWNFMFCLSESVELNKDSELLRDRVQCSTHKRDCLKNTQLVSDYNNYESLPDLDGVDNFENTGLAKDFSEPSYPVKRHANLRCHNCPVHANYKPYNPDLTKNEWKIKSTPVINNAYGDSMIKKSKIVGLKKIDINSQKVIYHEPLHLTVPLLQKGNLISENPKHSLLQLNLQDKTNQIESLISTPQHKLDEIISDKLVDKTLNNKLVQPSLTLPLPYKLIKHPVNNQLIQPSEIHNNVETARLKTDSNKNSNPLKLSSLLPHVPINQKDLKNKLSTLPSIKLNEPKPTDTLSSYRSSSQLLHIPAIKPIHLPNLVQKEVPLSSENERQQTNIDSSSQYSKIIKKGIAESTPQPIIIEKHVSMSLSHNKQHESMNLSPIQSIKTSDTETINKPITIIEKKVSMYCPHKNPQDSIDSSPPKQFMTNSNTETVHKPIKIEKEISISVSNEEKPNVDLPPQALQLLKTPETIGILGNSEANRIASVNGVV